jgi:5-methylcytosine-specific restriction protein A
MCKAAGRVTPATVADHIEPHRGDPDRFWNGKLQSLCDRRPWRCHSSVKQSEEALGYSEAIGEDGHPIDPRHPWNAA